MTEPRKGVEYEIEWVYIDEVTEYKKQPNIIIL